MTLLSIKMASVIQSTLENTHTWIKGPDYQSHCLMGTTIWVFLYI